MHEAIKEVIRPFYSTLHLVLHKTLEVNPFIPKKTNNKKIINGHIRIEQETNPELDKKIIELLNEHGIKNDSYRIDGLSFKKYLSETTYPSSYYGGVLTHDEFVEKALEHFVSFQWITLTEKSITLDIGAANSPFYKIVKTKTGTPFAYSQDKIFQKGIYENKIGCLASELPFENESVDVITLHCSLEHFEGAQDKDFFREAERVLLKGGKCIVLPFYLSSEYTVHLDPVYNLLKSYRPNISDDKNATIRYCDSRQHFSRHYDVKNFKERIVSTLHFLDVEIFHVENFKEINPDCYLRFIAIFTKK